MEEKGLFWRLLDFFREKIDLNVTGGIGFWKGSEDMEQHFAEMGAVVSLTQEEMKKMFWEKTDVTAGKNLQEETGESMEGNTVFFTEIKKTEEDTMVDPVQKRKRVEDIFSAETFWNEGRETEERNPNIFGKSFWTEKPEKKRDKRSSIPAMDMLAENKESSAEDKQEMLEREVLKQEENQTEPTIDIEMLMRQMTKKLWEERESCGRRLR